MAVTLTSSKNRLTLSALGARIADWECLDSSTQTWRKVVKSGSPDVPPSHIGYASAIMFPWVNRIGGDTWTLEEPGKDTLTVPVHPFPDNLHGTAADIRFDVTAQSESSVAFRATIPAQLLYPVPLECTITYSVADAPSVGNPEALHVNITAKNVADRNAYVGTGIHPYFVNPFGGAIESATLVIAAGKEFTVDQQLIPTGIADVTPQHAFPPPGREIGSTQIDNGFVVSAGVSEPIASLRLKNYALDVLRGENSGYIQVYVPGERDCIAIEPQSSGADAYRVHEYGNVVLAPGRSWTFTTVLSAKFS